ncbi:hypothetical protein ONE63_000400 [Megalurothrips usitatus]|uniref:Chitin-binding type-2 domain-containing protein n=1 Tax=Megalurothrips usitatus TaxID=439358 RepID=A0AAV7Y1S2_9NEOP|nr:hypothetical protein ONE63_000400 [Megalurothrips usitatus]
MGVAAQKRPPNFNPANMPDTQFDCSDKIVGGYYGDAETECQMFHVCVKVPGIGIQDFRFLCPNDTAFDQENQVCDDWYNIDCESSSLYFGDNFDLFRIGAGQTSAPRAPGSRPSPTPIALGPSTTRPALQPAPKAPQGLPPAPRTKPIASNDAGEEDDDFFLQRADTGDRRLHHGTSRDIFKGSQSGSFFNSKNGGKDDDDDYEPDTRPNAFRHSQKAKPTGPLPSFVQQYQQQPQQQQRPNNNNNQQQRPANNFQQQQQQRPANNFQQEQQQRPANNFQQQQRPANNFQQQQTTQPARQNFPQQQQQQNGFPQQNNNNNFAQQQDNSQRKKKVTVRRKLVQKGGQEPEQYQQQPQEPQQPQQPQQPRYQGDEEEYFRTYQQDQHSNVDSPNQAFGQRGNFPAIRTTPAPVSMARVGGITHPSTAATQTTGFLSGAPTTTFTTTTTVLDAARNHNYQTKARYNTIQRSRGEQPTAATEYFQSSTPAPATTQQQQQQTQKQYSLFYAKQQQQQQQASPTTPQPFQQQRASSPAAAATTANNNRFNYNTYKLNGGASTTTQSDDYERPEEQEFLKTAHSSNYRASDFNSFNRYNGKDSGSGAYNNKGASTTDNLPTTKPSSAFPVYFPTSPRPAPFSPPQTTLPPPQQRQSTSAATAAFQQQQTTGNNNLYSSQNAPRPFSPSPAPQGGSASSSVAAFNNQFNSNSRPASRSSATTSAPAPPPKKYTAKVVANSGSASPTAAAPIKSTAAAAPPKSKAPPKNDYDYAYYDDSDLGAYEYGLDPISDSHFAKTRTDSVKIKKEQ